MRVVRKTECRDTDLQRGGSPARLTHVADPSEEEIIIFRHYSHVSGLFCGGGDVLRFADLARMLLLLF